MESSSRWCVPIWMTPVHPEQSWKSRVCTNIFDGDGKLSKSLPTGKDAIDGELVMLLVRELKNFGP